MKKVAGLVVLLGFSFLLQDCSRNSVENDFSYESLKDTVSGTPFRNRKYDYARVEVKEAPALKIPTGLNGQQIKPALKLPEGSNNFAKSQVKEAEKEMLPPNYANKFNMAEIIGDQISKVSISVVYSDSGELKLVFREPLKITLNLLNDYFKERPEHYKLLSEEDEILSGKLIKVKDLEKDLIFVIKSRSIDELSSLVKVNTVYKSDGETLSPDYIAEGGKLLSDIRKALNDKELKSDENIKLAKQAEVALSASDSTTKKGNSGLGGLLGSPSKSRFGSYDRAMAKSNQQNLQENQPKEDYTEMTAPSGNQTYDSDVKPQILST